MLEAVSKDLCQELYIKLHVKQDGYDQDQLKNTRSGS